MDFVNPICYNIIVENPVRKSLSVSSDLSNTITEQAWATLSVFNMALTREQSFHPSWVKSEF